MRRLSLAVLVCVALPALAAPRAAKRPFHPDVTASLATQDCAGCHADASPEVARAWDASPHGVAQVKCFVCHGSTGEDFTRSPPPARCQGCHAAQVTSIVPAKGEGPTCFSCHHPHTLRAEAPQNPHLP
jgi:hypothetical protein